MKNVIHVTTPLDQGMPLSTITHHMRWEESTGKTVLDSIISNQNYTPLDIGIILPLSSGEFEVLHLQLHFFYRTVDNQQEHNVACNKGRVDFMYKLMKYQENQSYSPFYTSPNRNKGYPFALGKEVTEDYHSALDMRDPKDQVSYMMNRGCILHSPLDVSKTSWRIDNSSNRIVEANIKGRVRGFSSVYDIPNALPIDIRGWQVEENTEFDLHALPFYYGRLKSQTEVDDLKSEYPWIEFHETLMYSSSRIVTIPLAVRVNEKNPYIVYNMQLSSNWLFTLEYAMVYQHIQTSLYITTTDNIPGPGDHAYWQVVLLEPVCIFLEK